MIPISGARYLAEALHRHGVTHAFMVPAVLRRTMAELERRTAVRVIHAHGEKPAAYMADGYARASGRPGVCMAQHIGALNLAAGLRDAWLARSPVIAMSGGTAPLARFRGRYQAADDLPAFEAYTKLNAVVDDINGLPDLLAQAFRSATTGSPGPVHLQFLGQEGEIDAEVAPLTPRFDAAHTRVPPHRPAPAPGLAARAVARIRAARRPIIVAGGGVMHSRAARSLTALAEALSVPVATSLNGRGAIPEDHPLAVGVVGTYSRPTANQAVGEADLAILVGTSAGSMTTSFWTLPAPGTAVVQIDIDPAIIGRNYEPEIAIGADARAALEAMLDAVDEPAADTDWAGRNHARQGEWRQERSAMVRSDVVPIRPERVCHELTTWLPDDALLVVDTGHAGMWMASMFELRSPGQRFLRSAGHLGWAFPAGLGAKCACPQRPVITFTGDVGFWYHVGEIETAVRCGIDAITVVNNNHSGNQSTRGFSAAYDGAPSERSRELWVQREVDFARIATEIGALGIRVEDPAALRPALDRALAARRPAVIDVVTDIDALAPLAWTPG